MLKCWIVCRLFFLAWSLFHLAARLAASHCVCRPSGGNSAQAEGQATRSLVKAEPSDVPNLEAKTAIGKSLCFPHKVSQRFDMQNNVFHRLGVNNIAILRHFFQDCKSFAEKIARLCLINAQPLRYLRHLRFITSFKYVRFISISASCIWTPAETPCYCLITYLSWDSLTKKQHHVCQKSSLCSIQKKRRKGRFSKFVFSNSYWITVVSAFISSNSRISSSGVFPKFLMACSAEGAKSLSG